MEQFGKMQQPSPEDGMRHAEEVSYFEPVLVEKLDFVQAAEILSKTEIHGSHFDGERLTVDDLRAAGLAPVFRLRFSEGVDMSVSPVYQLGDEEYLAAVVYVHDEKATVARSYYMSRSQGVWRYLPQYLPSSGKIEWFSKWVSEFAITGPSELQQALAGLETKKPLVVKKPMKIFAGTARSLFAEAGSIARLVNELPEVLPQVETGYHRSGGKKEYCAPESVGTRIPPEKQPLFSLGPVAEWKTKNALYGEVICELFVSEDKSLRYQFCRDTLGRAWLANIENTSPITSVGVRSSWVDGGDLITPAFEYSSQSSHYGNAKVTKKKYVDMYDNYLSHIPMIRRYMQSAVKRELDPLMRVKIVRGLVRSASSIAQLYEVLRSIPEDNPGSGEWETVIACIGMLLIGEGGKKNITNRYGIRRRAYELMIGDKAKKRS